MKGQHVELASKKKSSWQANTLSWLVKYMKSKQPMCDHRLKMFLKDSYEFQVNRQY